MPPVFPLDLLPGAKEANGYRRLLLLLGYIVPILFTRGPDLGAPMAGRQRICLTSAVFRWLCDIHAVRQEHGEGFSAGGMALTPDGAQQTFGGSPPAPGLESCRVFSRVWARLCGRGQTWGADSGLLTHCRRKAPGSYCAVLPISGGRHC